MMCDQDLPTSLWEEASNTTVYFQNRSLHAILGEKTPEEVFTGEKLDIGHMNNFGCLVDNHVPKEKRIKMDPYRKKHNFIGYSESSKAYKIYVPGQRHVEVRRYVKFHEESTFKCSK